MDPLFGPSVLVRVAGIENVSIVLVVSGNPNQPRSISSRPPGLGAITSLRAMSMTKSRKFAKLGPMMVLDWQKRKKMGMKFHHKSKIAP
jgi:hypothetical protein